MKLSTPIAEHKQDTLIALLANFNYYVQYQHQTTKYRYDKPASLGFPEFENELPITLTDESLFKIRKDFHGMNITDFVMNNAFFGEWSKMTDYSKLRQFASILANDGWLTINPNEANSYFATKEFLFIAKYRTNNFKLPSLEELSEIINDRQLSPKFDPQNRFMYGAWGETGWSNDYLLETLTKSGDFFVDHQSDKPQFYSRRGETFQRAYQIAKLKQLLPETEFADFVFNNNDLSLANQIYKQETQSKEIN